MGDERRELLNLRAIEISLRSALAHAPASRAALIARATELYDAARLDATTQRVRDEADRLRLAAADGEERGEVGQAPIERAGAPPTR